MRDTFPSDIQNVLNGKIPQGFVKKIRQSCFVVWKEKTKKPLILIGKNAKVWEEKLSPKLNRQTQIVKGNCASRGKAKGRVRVLLNASENNKLKKGEVLVTFMTSPDFMPVIKKCSAIVTNLGGITSHAAIISREFGIPCIVGTKNATDILKTGDLVEVDADKGIVRIIDSVHAS
jgi:pyruvate,water dikinase